MLSDKQTQLLSAYVDGELGNRQRRLAIRLLRKSPEARRLFRDLQKDSRLLAALPPQLPPADFTRQVVSYVADQLPKVPATPSTLEPVPVAAGWPSWISLAVAASVLILVTFVSYQFFANRPTPLPDLQYVDNKTPEPSKPPEPPPQPPKIEPQAPPKPLLAFEMREFKKHREKLAEEFKRESAVQIELTTRNPAQVTQNLKEVLNQNGVNLLVDAQVQKLMDAQVKNPGTAKGTTRYFLFMEDITTTQAAAILEDLAKKQNVKQPTVNDIALDRISGDMRAQLATVLGISVSELEPARKTEEKISFSSPPPEQPFVAEPGGKPATNPKPGGKPATKQSKHVAVMLALSADMAGGQAAAAIQQFKKSRLPARPDNTLQMVIELKQMQA